MQVQLKSLGKLEGAYRTAAVSGLITGVAAGTATAGHLFAMRWAPSSSPYAENMVRFCAIQRLRAKWRTVAGFTAGQEVGLEAFFARSYSASHTGGTALTLTGNNAQKRTGVAPAAGGAAAGGMPASQMADMRIASTTALTAGTQTLDAQPFARDGYTELAQAATVAVGRFDVEFVNQDQPGYPLVLSPNEGIVIRNSVAMGAGGTARVIVEVDWLELARY